jgi:hypothetical protein
MLLIGRHEGTQCPKSVAMWVISGRRNLDWSQSGGEHSIQQTIGEQSNLQNLISEHPAGYGKPSRR